MRVDASRPRLEEEDAKSEHGEQVANPQNPSLHVSSACSSYPSFAVGVNHAQMYILDRLRS